MLAKCIWKWRIMQQSSVYQKTTEHDLRHSIVALKLSDLLNLYLQDKVKLCLIRILYIDRKSINAILKREYIIYLNRFFYLVISLLFLIFPYNFLKSW